MKTKLFQISNKLQSHGGPSLHFSFLFNSRAFHRHPRGAVRKERDASRVARMQNVGEDQSARGAALKEGRMWTTKAEESDFGGAIVGNAEHTRSYLICMHIVTALALEPESTCSGCDAHASPFAREKGR